MENINKLASREDVEQKDSLVESYAKYMLSEDKDQIIKDSTDVQKTAVKVANTTLIHIPGLSFLYDKWADLQKKFILMLRKDARDYIEKKDKERKSGNASKEFRDSMNKGTFKSRENAIQIDSSRDNGIKTERVSDGFSR